MEIKSNGFILRLVPAQEADLILRILLPSGEKISGFAKAARKSKKRFAGALDPLLHIHFRARKTPQSDLYFLEEAVVKKEFPQIRTCFESLIAASSMIELVEFNAFEGLENKALYNLFGAALTALNNGASPTETFVAFQAKMISIMGWLPQYQQCSLCQATGHLTLDMDQSIVACGDCHTGTINLSLDVQSALGVVLTSPFEKLVFSELGSHKLRPFVEAFLAHRLDRQGTKTQSFQKRVHKFIENQMVDGAGDFRVK